MLWRGKETTHRDLEKLVLPTAYVLFPGISSVRTATRVEADKCRSVAQTVVCRFMVSSNCLPW